MPDGDEMAVAEMTASAFFRSNAFGLAILACAAVSFAFPSAFTSWGGIKLTKLVTPAIQVIMFGMGTTLTFADFMRVAKCPWAVATGVILQFLIMPLVGFTLALALGLSGELAAGCVLIGSVAGGTASNVIAYLAKANVALSVTMTCCSTLLSPFVTPFLMKTLAGRFVTIDAKAMMVSILMIVIVPVAAGGLVRWFFKKPLEAHKALVDKVLSFVSMAGICYTILALTAPSRETFKEAGALIILAAVLHNSFGYASGYWLTRLFGRFLRLDERDARTVAIEVGMQNGGMAGALATDVLKSAVAALPANVFSIWMNFSGSIIANWWSKKPVEGAQKMNGFMRLGCIVLVATVVAGCRLSLREQQSPHIVAKISDAAKYERLNPHFGKAFKFLCRPNLADLKPGRYEIDGENCWAMIQDANLTPFENGEIKVEAHWKYIDIQSPITGPETFGLFLMDDVHRTLPFNEAKDIVFFNAVTMPMTLNPGEFAIFFPPDGAHAPGHCVGNVRNIRKLVIKVLHD